MSRRRRHRRDIAESGLAFLDVISCGFGAIILLLIISKTALPVRLEESRIDLVAQIARREETLYQIRGRVTELRRQVSAVESQVDDNRLKLIAVHRELSDILGRHEAAAGLRQRALESTRQLAAAKQSLTDEMQRLLGEGFQRTSELVGGVAVDSEYLIFVIDTSGSMFNAAWGALLKKVEETLAIYPGLKGIQVMNDEGEYMFPQSAGEWIEDSPARRTAILKRLQTWNPFSDSSPVEGIEAAISSFYSIDRPMSIYVMGDDFTGQSIEAVVDEVDRLNRADSTGRRLVRINAVGFPVYLEQPSARVYRFAALMRELAYRNGGTFVGIMELD
jgi:hypothetical protein